MYKLKTSITSLSLMTSLGCNLNCSYCQIAKAANEKGPQLQQETISALKSGKFLDNILKVLDKLDQSPANISHIALWGQEPTLTLEYLTANIDQWIKAFPHWGGCMFSTNGIANGDKIFDFIKTLDLALDHELKMEIQFSFDGEESTSNIRNANSLAIYNTIRKLLLDLNSLKLNYVQPHFYFHGVVSFDLIDRLNTPEKIISYVKNLDEWAFELGDLNTNNMVHVDKTLSVALENPYDASSFDGQKLSNFYKNAIRINPKNFKTVNPIPSLLGIYTSWDMIVGQFGAKDLYDLIDKMCQDKKLFNQVMEAMNNLIFCGNSFGELKLMYDGTIINCQNSIYDRDKEFLKADTDLALNMKKSWVNHHYFVNPLTDSEEVLRKHFELFETCKTSCYSFIFNSTITQMFWLSRAHQIDDSYNDYKKLIAHAFILANFNCCTYNNQVKAGSHYLRPLSLIRMFCNGLIDEIIDYHRLAWGIQERRRGEPK